MPLGAMEEDRTDQYVSLAEVRTMLASIWTLTPEAYATGGPARYPACGGDRRPGSGLITPLSHNFCETCKSPCGYPARVRCTPAWGRRTPTDLRALLRGSDDDSPVQAAVLGALGRQAQGPRLFDQPGLTPGGGAATCPPQEAERGARTPVRRSVRHRRMASAGGAGGDPW